MDGVNDTDLEQDVMGLHPLLCKQPTISLTACGLVG